jgi:hypothetical protein
MTPGIDPLGPVFEPSRLALSTIPHTLALQWVRLRCQAAGWRSWERTRGSFNQQKGEARPDAIAKTGGGQTVAIEIENSLKSAKRYQAIFAAHLRAIQAGQYVGVFYVSPGPVAKGLERLFAAIKVLPGGIAFDQARRGRFEIRDIDSFP